MEGPIDGDSPVAPAHIGATVLEAPATSAARRLLPGAASNEALTRIAELASRLLAAPASQVSLLTDIELVAGGAGLASGAVGSSVLLEESLCAVTAQGRAPLVVPDAATDDRVRGLPPVARGEIGSYLGVPLLGDDGQAVGALCVFGPEPREWSPGDVMLLSQLASTSVAELELAALTSEHESQRLALDLAIDAAQVGTFDWHLDSGELLWDDRLNRLFGYDRDTFDGTIDAFNARLHPDDLPRVAAALRAAIETCGEYTAEYRVVLPDGTTRWVAARGRALCDDQGRATRVLGAAYDTTRTHDAEVRVARVLETMSAAFFLLDSQWRFAYVNSQAERLLGRSREELVSGNVWKLFPFALGTDFETNYREAVALGEPRSFEAYYPPPLDAWYEVQAWPDEEGLSVYFLDITARRQAQARSDAAAVRASLLAEVTSELTENLESTAAVSRLAQLVVPALGDWCIVTLVDDEEHAGSLHGLRDVGWWHGDPELRPLVETYAATRLQSLSDESYLATALATGEMVQVREQASAAVQRVLAEGPARDALTELAPGSVAILPLRGRGRTVGMLTLFSTRERGPISEDDLTTLKEVAGRAGLALDNSRLYRQQRRVAEELQRAMLTEPPEPDHVQVVVRYSPATEAAQVGGDWYDAFLQPDGATILVIGDVVGHDVAAAAAMGQVRTLLRGIAAHTGDGPAEVLRGVDRVMQTLQVSTTATVVVARVEQTPEERSREVTRVRWSNAGHPPPMLLNADGTVAPLMGVDADLLLGIDPDSKRIEAEVTVDRGATVLLYTDGLVERRGQSIDDGLTQLRDLLEELARESPTLDELCDRVLERMVPEQAEDDVALVAVRLHAQTAPRPAEAGPNRVPPNVPKDPEVPIRTAGG